MAVPAAASSRHLPVLLHEVLRELRLAPGLTVVDGTVGGGGHSRQIAEKIAPNGRLIGLDRDAMMLDLARQVLPSDVLLRQGTYNEAPAALAAVGLKSADRMLLDLGYSSDQLADESRGFSFDASGPLDLRFDTHQGFSAADWLANVDAGTLREVLHNFGEEPQADRLAQAILAQQRSQPIQTAGQLAALCERVLGPARGKAARHPATQTFQALRIAVNRELEHVQDALTHTLPRCLTTGGIAAVITFHSLEDRATKQAFRDSTWWEQPTPKVIEPTPNEVRFNPRSRSAKLRVAVRNATPYPA